jgi:hypothetical protein
MVAHISCKKAAGSLSSMVLPLSYTGALLRCLTARWFLGHLLERGLPASSTKRV